MTLRTAATLTALLATLSLGACSSPSTPGERALVGSLIGAGIGAGAASVTGGHAGTGAGIGAAAGLLAGVIYE